MNINGILDNKILGQELSFAARPSKLWFFSAYGSVFLVTKTIMESFKLVV